MDEANRADEIITDVPLSAVVNPASAETSQTHFSLSDSSCTQVKAASWRCSLNPESDRSMDHLQQDTFSCTRTDSLTQTRRDQVTRGGYSICVGMEDGPGAPRRLQLGGASCFCVAGQEEAAS